MYKAIIISIFLFSVALLSASPKMHLARVHYQGGGDWYNDPDILPNLAEYLNKKMNTKFHSEQSIVKLGDKKIFDFPFIFLTGHGNIDLTSKEIINLKTYLENGGFLYVDDDYGLDKSFKREIKKVFPDKSLVELPSSHELFDCFFKFPKGIPKIHKHDNKKPRAFAIFDNYGRMMVLYTFESNISDGWASANVHKDPKEIRELALKMGVNIIYYILTQ